MIRIVRASISVLLIVLLAPTTSSADGLGGLSAMRSLADAAISFVAVVFVAIWAVAFAARRARTSVRSEQAESPLAAAARSEPGSEPSDRQRYWLLDRDIPIGLRALRVLQYGLAFPYACSGLLRLIMPAAYHNDHVAEWVLQWIAFCCTFSVLAILSANAYVRRGDPRGWKLGVALGWLCVGNAVVGWIFHGRYDGFDPISATFGVGLLAMMQFAYRGWFGCESSTPWARKLAVSGGIFVGGITGLVFLLAGTSLMLTGPLQLDREDAAAHLEIVNEAMQDYYDEHGEWPGRLGDLPSDVDLSYRWKSVQYDRDEPIIYFDVRIPLDPPGLGYRLTFGRAGFTPEISRVGRTLRPRGETAAAS